jgi:two-component system, NarL family, sensor histidine kinase UhpB
MKMPGPLKILMLEDSSTDAEIVQRLLKKELTDCTIQLAMDKPAFSDALQQFKPDIILADNSLPQFNATEALALLKENNLSIPFIMVTGTVSEEFAAGIIRSGADDYILKDRMTRLPAAIATAVKKRNVEKEKANALRELQESEERYRNLFERNLAGVYQTTPDGKIISCNDAMARILGYTSHNDLEKQNAYIFYFSPEERDNLVARLRKEKHLSNYESVMRRVDGGAVYTIENVSLYTDETSGEILEGIMIDISDRKKNENELMAKNEQLRELSEHLQNVREQERTNIAREIHDELAQQLTLIKMDITSLQKKLTNSDQMTTDTLEGLRAMVDESVKSVRKISSQLRPSILDDMGLTAAIEWQLNDFGKRSGIDTRLTALKEELPIPDMIRTGLFRIVQESLTNVARYANARHVNVSLEHKNNELLLSITDDGIGFDSKAVTAKKTFGLLGMKERAAMMKGHYMIETAPGKGTTVIVSIPFKN